MRHSLITLAVIIVAAYSGSEVRADSFLGNAAGYTEFILGNSTRTGDSTGQVAVGGNATFTNFSVGSGVTFSNETGVTTGSQTAYYDAIVNGQLGGTQLNNGGPGNVIYGSLQSGMNVYNNRSNNTGTTGSTVANQTIPNFFSNAATTLTNDSNTLARQTANGTTTYLSNALSLTGTANASTSTLYFNVTAAQLAGATGLTITITDNNGATPVVIVNVTNPGGAAITIANTYQTTISGVTDNHLLYNFQNTPTLTLNNNAIYGSILAPLTAITANSGGQVNGEVIAASFTGNIETHVNDANSGQYDLFNGSPSLVSVPEPATIVSTLTGLAMVGGAVWRRRRRRPA